MSRQNSRTAAAVSFLLPALCLALLIGCDDDQYQRAAAFGSPTPPPPRSGTAATAPGPAARRGAPTPAAARAPAGAPRRIAPAEAMRRIQSGERIVLLDVRTDLERDLAGHLANDINVPFGPKNTFPMRVREAIPDRNAVVFVYCKSGILSTEAGRIMAGLGYTQVSLLGGMDDWPYKQMLVR